MSQWHLCQNSRFVNLNLFCKILPKLIFQMLSLSYIKYRLNNNYCNFIGSFVTEMFNIFVDTRDIKWVPQLQGYCSKCSLSSTIRLTRPPFDYGFSLWSLNEFYWQLQYRSVLCFYCFSLVQIRILFRS